LSLPKDPQLDIFAETACLVSGCANALIAIMESQTQVIQSCIGISLETVDRQNTVCQYSIASGEVVVINDTLSDERSSGNPLIIAGGIRFYAGIPLLMRKVLHWEPSVCLIMSQNLYPKNRFSPFKN
jgi:GAF domain-containing protein